MTSMTSTTALKHFDIFLKFPFSLNFFSAGTQILFLFFSVYFSKSPIHTYYNNTTMYYSYALSLRTPFDVCVIRCSCVALGVVHVLL